MASLTRWWKRNRIRQPTKMKKKTIGIEDQIQVLQETIDWYKAQILPHDCGWMYTTISGIQKRIDDLKRQIPPRPNIHL